MSHSIDVCKDYNISEKYNYSGLLFLSLFGHFSQWIPSEYFRQVRPVYLTLNETKIYNLSTY